MTDKDNATFNKDIPEKSVSRRHTIKEIAAAAVCSTLGPEVAQAANGSSRIEQEKNPYGAPAGSGISMPAYYRPTPSVKNRNNFFPQTEEVGADEMRITYMGSNPWPPRLDQAGTCMMVELANGSRFFFDFGSGCLRNII